MNVEKDYTPVTKLIRYLDGVNFNPDPFELKRYALLLLEQERAIIEDACFITAIEVCLDHLEKTPEEWAQDIENENKKTRGQEYYESRFLEYKNPFK